jgi:hypothetical protein
MFPAPCRYTADDARSSTIRNDRRCALPKQGPNLVSRRGTGYSIRRLDQLAAPEPDEIDVASPGGELKTRCVVSAQSATRRDRTL